MGHQSERCQFTSKPVSWTQPHVCFQLQLLPQKPCSCGKGLKIGKGVYCSACVCPECVCACLGTHLHTHMPPGGQFMGMFMGKESGRLVLVLLGTKKNLTNFSFARNTTSSQRRKTPASPLLRDGFAKAASCQRSSLQQHPAREHRDSGNYRCAGCWPLLCPQSQLWEPGCWCVWSCSLAWSARTVLAAPA